MSIEIKYEEYFYARSHFLSFLIELLMFSLLLANLWGVVGSLIEHEPFKYFSREFSMVGEDAFVLRA